MYIGKHKPKIYQKKIKWTHSFIKINYNCLDSQSQGIKKPVIKIITGFLFYYISKF